MSIVQFSSSKDLFFPSHSKRIITRAESNCSLLWSKFLLIQKSLTNIAVAQYIIPLNLRQSRSLYTLTYYSIIKITWLLIVTWINDLWLQGNAEKTTVSSKGLSCIVIHFILYGLGSTTYMFPI